MRTAAFYIQTCSVQHRGKPWTWLGQQGQDTATPVLAEILTIWVDISGPKTTKNKRLSTNGEEEQWGLHGTLTFLDKYVYVSQSSEVHAFFPTFSICLTTAFTAHRHIHTYTFIHTYMTHMYSCAGEIKMSAPLCPLGSISINSGVWRECPPMHWELSCLWYHLAPWELTALAQDSLSPKSQSTISTLHSCTSSTWSGSARHQQHICDCPNTVDYRKQPGKGKACNRHGMGQPWWSHTALRYRGCIIQQELDKILQHSTR